MLSLCASVCVSHIKTAKHFVEVLLPADSPAILVFRHRGSLLNSDGFTPNECAKYKGGGEKIGRFLTNKAVHLGNGARYGHVGLVAIEVN